MKHKEVCHFVLKVGLFLIPFLGLSVLGFFGYNKSGGDLNRLSKISYPLDYRNQFKIAFDKEQKWTSFSELDLDTNYSFDVFIIGDSFSNTKGSYYQNHLEEGGYNVLNFDWNSYNIEGYNPSRILYQLMEAGTLDILKPNYVILEIVERNFINDVKNFYTQESLSLKKFNLKEGVGNRQTSKFKATLNDITLFYRYGIFYQFNDHAFRAPVYKFNMNKPLFSAREFRLLCYSNDINSIYGVSIDSMTEAVSKLRVLRDRLSEKGIQLIVLPAPDKYDVYYDFIEANRHPKNPFFDMISQLEVENYIINTKELFTPCLLNGVKDLYFADDTHWSPIGAKIVGDNLIKMIDTKNKQDIHL